jgi:DNA invertase Pin-like site-specific DNA recombinase
MPNRSATALAPQPSLRVGIAVRRSKKSVGAFEQYGVEASPARQTRDILEWKKRNAPDGIVTAEFEEDGYSAWEVKGQPRRRRPELEREIATIESGQLDLMVHWMVDRAARGYTNGHRLWQACQATNTRLVFVADGLDSTHPMFEEMYFRMLGMAKWYSDRISAGVTQALEAMDRAGRKRLTKRRFGFLRDGVTPLTQEVVDALEAKGQTVWTVTRKPRGAPPAQVEVPIIAEFERLAELGDRIQEGESLSPKERAEKGLTLSCIERDWTAAAIRSTTGGRISRAGLLCMVRNPRNAPAFDGPERHARILRIVNDPARRSQRGSDRVHLATGRFNNDDPKNAHLCGRCLEGGTIAIMAAIKGKERKNPSYICPECGVARQMAVVDTLVRDDLFHRLESPEVERGLASATATARGRRQELLAEREPLQTHLDKLQESLNERRADPGTDWDDPEVKADLAAARNLKVRVDKIDLTLARQGEVVQRSRNPLLNEARKLAKHRERLERFWEGLDGAQRHALCVADGLVRVVTHEVGKVGPCWSADPSKIERYWCGPDGELDRRVGPSPGSREEPRTAKPSPPRQACACGCGELAAPGRRFRQGHNPKLDARAAWLAKQPKQVACHCGCGQLIPVRLWHFDRGLPRFKLGHHMRMAEFKLAYRG